MKTEIVHSVIFEEKELAHALKTLYLFDELRETMKAVGADHIMSNETGECITMDWIDTARSALQSMIYVGNWCLPYAEDCKFNIQDEDEYSDDYLTYWEKMEPRI